MLYYQQIGNYIREVKKDMRTIYSLEGKLCYLSDELYEVTKDHEINNTTAGTLVRLISGVDGSNTPGYHFTNGYYTVHIVGSPHATFRGIPKDKLRRLS